MATTYTTALNQYKGNGVSTTFSVTFPYTKKSDVKVYLKQGLNIQVVLEQDVDYSFIDDETILFPIEGSQYGVLTADDVLAFQRESSFSSEYVFSNQKRLFPEEVMNSDDNLMRLVQENKRDLEKAIKIQPTSTIDSDTFFNEVDRIYQSIDSVDVVAGVAGEISIVAKEIDAIIDAPNLANKAEENAEKAEKSAISAVASATLSQEQAELSQSHAEHAAGEVAGLESFVQEKQNEISVSLAEAIKASEDAKKYADEASSVSVGNIFYTSRLDTELNGAVEANGGIYNVNAFTGEHSVPALLAKGKLPYVSMAEYESIVSANGSCRAWGWDNGDTFRVPTVKALLLTKEQAAVVGNGMTLGLTNGTSVYGLTTGGNNTFAGYTANYGGNVGVANSGNVSTSNKSYGVTTDPEKSGIVANLDVVEYRAMVQLSTGVKEDATQLKEYKFNNPHFFGESKWTDVDPKNGSWLASNGAYHSGRTYVGYYEWLTNHIGETITFSGGKIVTTNDEYTEYDWVVNTSDETFRLPLLNGEEDIPGGEVELISLDTTASVHSVTRNKNGFYSVNVNSSTSVSLICEVKGVYESAFTSDSRTSRCSLFAKAGQEFLYAWNGSATSITSNSGIRFITAVGNGSLYFYVGDVLQDPALINVGGVLSDVANLRQKLDAKLDRDGAFLVIAHYKNGTSWYRLWSDGWIEQGGIFTAASGTINLLMPMKDTNYIINMHATTGKKTINSIVFSGATVSASWEVKGYHQQLYKEVVSDGNYYSEALYTDEAKTNRVYFMQRDTVNVAPSWDTYKVTFRVPMKRIDYFTCTPGGYAGIPTPSLTGYTVSGQNVDYVRQSPYLVIGA